MEFEVNRLLSPYLYNDILSSIKRTDFSAFTGKTVLITGASKPLGYYLACALLINNDLNSEGAKIIAVDSSDKLMEKFGKLTYRGDIDFVVTRDYSYLGGERADIVIHTEDITELEPFTASLNLLRFITSNRAKAAIAEKGRDNVINGTIGALLDDEGKLIVLKSVDEVYRQLAPTDYAEYAPIGGTKRSRLREERVRCVTSYPTIRNRAIRC